MGGEALYKQRLAQGRGDKALVAVACRLNQNEKDWININICSQLSKCLFESTEYSSNHATILDNGRDSEERKLNAQEQST